VIDLPNSDPPSGDTDAVPPIAGQTLEAMRDSMPYVLHPEHRVRLWGQDAVLVATVRQLVTQLEDLTDWSQETVLARLGCPLEDTKDVPPFYLKKLKTCRSFIGLVHGLASAVDTTDDRRAIVTSLARLLNLARQNARLLDDALNEAGTGSFSPIDYILLGEVSDGAALARARLLGEEHQDTNNPFGAAPTVHLSESRLRLYVRDQREALGPEVFLRMRVHLEGNKDEDVRRCDACREAADRIAARLNRSPVSAIA
jgi:hypothetical protein